MFCYECDQHGSAVIAIAICHRCGGAICRKHAHTLTHSGAPGGMMGLSQPTREHVCEHCLAGDALQSSHAPASEKKGGADLPDARTAIYIAETLVRHKSKHPRSQQRWRALYQRLARLLAKRQMPHPKTPSEV